MKILHVLRKDNIMVYDVNRETYRTFKSASDFFPDFLSCFLLDNSTYLVDHYQKYIFGPKQFSFLDFLLFSQFSNLLPLESSLNFLFTHFKPIIKLFYSKKPSLILLRNQQKFYFCLYYLQCSLSNSLHWTAFFYAIKRIEELPQLSAPFL